MIPSHLRIPAKEAPGRRIGLLALKLSLLLAIFAFGAIVLVPLGHATTKGTAASRSPAKSFGYSAHILQQSDPTRYTALISEGGATSVRDDFQWSSVEAVKGVFDWTGTDELVREAATHHLHVLMLADTTPLWASGTSASEPDWQWLPPLKPVDYGTFVGKLAARYGAQGTFWKRNPGVPKVLPAGIELWNEENTSDFWGGLTPDPQIYTAMVKAAFVAIKAADRGMTVVLGGLAPAGAYDDVNCTGVQGADYGPTEWNPLNFLEAVYIDGGEGFFDAVGWHPYNFWPGASAEAMLAYNPCSAWSEMDATPVSVRSIMEAYGDGAKRIWITETGVPACVNGALYICVSLSIQAQLATREVKLWKSYKWAGNFYWYDIRDDVGGVSRSDMQDHFGVTAPNDVPAPAYGALRDAWESGADT